MRMFTKNLSTDKKLSSKQQADFLLIISKLLGNGFSLNQSINCLRLLENKHDVFEKIHQDLQNGAMISQALRHLQLPNVIFNQIVIAQNHGKIDQTLKQTGILLKSQAQQKNKLKELLVYPGFILMFLLTMLIGMKIYIVPQLAIAGSGKSIDLFLGIILISLILLASGIIFLIADLRRKDEYHRSLLLVKLPLVGKIYLHFFQFLILQGLGMQLASGMNFFIICESSNRFQKGSIQRYLGNKFIQELQQGKSLEQMIQEEPLLPNQLQIIVQAGESGPQLAQDLLLISELKFEETKQELKKLLNLIQPILFGIIAIVIVVTYLIVLMPIYGMMRGLS
ncbi:type II secretion system F family protein [Companilactobacillus futsaii]|uniref:Competence protein ComG n=1 Tax=Companilactobacillus futsaii TaxID=938155 RepID=A0A5B7T3R5_9LACO|nr:type II secretion system F family protein [Companilactobacillus futsaii]QCX25209.1 competence protein ComG [Companilactobacillus futsaii]